MRAWAIGMRISTDVSGRPFSRSEIVCVRTAGPAARASRSALTARLADCGVLAESEVPERSRPDANWTALKVSATAITPKVPLQISGMFKPAVICVAPWRSTTQRQRNRGVQGANYHLTVSKKYLEKIIGGWNDSGACASSRQPVIPPAPLTGDVGRGCGDASRALLFLILPSPFEARHARATSEFGIASKAPPIIAIVSEFFSIFFRMIRGDGFVACRLGCQLIAMV